MNTATHNPVASGAHGLTARTTRELHQFSGAISAGMVADVLGLNWAIKLAAARLLISGALVAYFMRERMHANATLTLQRA
jgi:hypothetical protein